MRRVWVSLAVTALFLAALPLAAQTGAWTAVGSTGVVDESAAAIYAFGSTNLTYLSSSTSTNAIVARYNVTNTWGMSDTPPWTTMEMGYIDSNPSVNVRADLFKVDLCTGAQTLICTAASLDSATATCVRCQGFASNTINFGANAYYVQVTLSRTAPTVAPPSLLSLRIR